MGIINARIYKPRRILFYIKPTQEEIEEFYEGKIPEILMKYDGTFGSYDCPGLFVINNENGKQKVLGIEYRPEDDRIIYPDNLESMILPEAFMVSSLLTDIGTINEKMIEDSLVQIKQDLYETNFYGGVITVMDEPMVMQIFTLNGHNRILTQANAVKEESIFLCEEPKTELERKLYFSSYCDFITQHYNWNYIWPVIAGFGYKGIQDFSFAHFDVKDFNAINVVYGHEIANRLLIQIANKVKTQDWIYFSARCDNDNFSMMIKDMPKEETRQKLMDLFESISTLESDPNYHVYYRCGVVPMRNTLLLGDRVADAGKQVQRLGTKPYETEVLFYTEKMHDDLEWSIRTRLYFDTAIKKDEFLIYLQPKYDIGSEKLCGAEALIRWNYHGTQLLSPARFIPIFETGGLITKLDDIVLHKVCSCLNRWEKEGLPLYPISVNVSRKSMGVARLSEHLTEIVDMYGVDHSLIDFELTESAAYDNQEYMISVIKDLKKNGFKISMDDFGTGYSSLSLLSLMPFDTIKIDKSFVDAIGINKECAKECVTIKHIITMSKDLEFECLAEGAERKEQVELLKKFGCDIIQGYYYSKPLPVEEYEKKLVM